MVSDAKRKHIFGTTKMNDRGQFVIPKKARELFGINNDDLLVALGDEADVNKKLNNIMKTIRHLQ